MNRISFYGLWIFFALLLFAVPAYAASGHMPLLTVSEGANNTETGGVADLYLVIQPGTGRIFIDSYPLSKLDTQITIRFATELACDYLGRDCSQYDFFYTITANSALVGGPSAGAATTVLATALLDSQKIRTDTVMTGTINSGYLIGPVAGIHAKALAAQADGYNKILVPRWDTLMQDINTNIPVNASITDNASIVANTDALNNNIAGLKIDVITVSTLDDAMYEFTGKNYTKKLLLQDSKEYDKIMQQITIELCSRYGNVRNGTLILPNITSYEARYAGRSKGSSIKNINESESSNKSSNASDQFVMALDAINNHSYYSAASFCFSGDVRIAGLLLSNMSNDDLRILYARLLQNISTLEDDMDLRAYNLTTITELETYMIVEERLYDAKKTLSGQNLTDISPSDMAYARERFNTAVVWSEFFAMPGAKFVMDESVLRAACSQKISEAEERLNYLGLYSPDTDARSSLGKAYDYYNSREYALCIFTASRVKADANVVLSALFVNKNDIERLLAEKLDAARNAIARQESAGIFPILGYSYYEYANTLSSRDKYSGLIYAEYALEFSNLGMYLKKSSTASLPWMIDAIYIRIFVLGLLIGALLTVIVLRIFRRTLKHEKVVKALRKSRR
jgi:uncharacterized protein